MRYGIIAIGSRGDVQPFIALALGLEDAGHEATVIAPENFKRLVEGYGARFFPLHGNIEEILHTPAGKKVLQSGNAFTLLRYLQRCGREVQERRNQDTLIACETADVLISSLLAMPVVGSIAEFSQKKWAVVQLSFPSTPTREFPFVGLDFMDFPSYNIFTYRLLRWFYWRLSKSDVNTFRRQLGLPLMTRSTFNKAAEGGIPNLYGVSPSLLSRPKDWDDLIAVTGFLTLPPNAEPIPPGLTEWLQAGDKPVYIGFGSIPVPDPALFSRILTDMLAMGKHRFIFCQGWSDPPAVAAHPDLFVVKSINHQWLLPQCSAAIIHGGSGTVAAVLSAKTPLVIASIFGDQPWWGKLMAKKQLGAHIPFSQISTRTLLDALDLVQAQDMRERVRNMGEQMNREDGVATAINALERYFA